MLLLVIAIAIVACGGTSTAIPANPVAKAAEKTLRSGSELMTIDSTWIGPGVVDRVWGTGAFDTDAGRGWADFRLAITSERPDGSHLDNLARPAVFDHELLWLRSEDPVEGKHWLKNDRRWGMQAGWDLAVQVGQTPADVLGQLRGASGAIVTLGNEKVAGAQTTHYRVAGGLPDNEILRQVNAVASPSIWIDDEGLVRKARVHYTVDAETGRHPTRAQFTVAMGFTKFGAPVSVTLPPVADTVSANGYHGD